MKSRILKEKDIEEFCEYMRSEERSEATITKYKHDVAAFCTYCKNENLTKNTVLQYKAKLIADGYAVRSINSMLAAINSFLSFLGRQDLKVKALKLQWHAFCPTEKELTKGEYERLCRTAERNGKSRSSLIFQTICGTGIRVSELQYITVEAARNGVACASCKGKVRRI